MQTKIFAIPATKENPVEQKLCLYDMHNHIGSEIIRSRLDSGCIKFTKKISVFRRKLLQVFVSMFATQVWAAGTPGQQGSLPTSAWTGAAVMEAGRKSAPPQGGGRTQGRHRGSAGARCLPAGWGCSSRWDNRRAEPVKCYTASNEETPQSVRRAQRSWRIRVWSHGSINLHFF